MAPQGKQLGTTRKTQIAIVVAVLGALAQIAKRSYKNAKLMFLVKRLLGWMLGRILPIPSPQVTSGAGSCAKIGSIMRDAKCRHPMVVTDSMLVQHGLVQKCLDSLEAAGLKYHVFDGVVPNPPTEVVDQAHDLYKSQGCDSIIGFGGGSPMDVAKVLGAKIANPRPKVSDYAGVFKVLYSLPPFLAVPTTAGTGSETTIVAMITIKEENRKVMIGDLSLVPKYAVLDPEILVKLPKAITAATGMDALTHAVEAYLGGWTSVFTRKLSLSAVEKIFRDLLTTFKDGSNLDARESMLNASYEAGLSFTRASVGYVHAIAHQFGGMFHTPHGDANAMLLPHVLKFYLRDEAEGSTDSSCTDKYCELAKAAGLVQGVDANTATAKRVLAREFVERIAAMNADMSIPTEVKDMKASDVDEVATRALKEAHGELHGMSNPVAHLLDLGYPVPKYMTHDDCKAIIASVLPAEEKDKYFK